MRFANAVEAKDFFVSRIVEQASMEGTPLSELEQTMLRFTETGTDAKPEYIEAAGEFDSQHDSQAYEEKIRTLLKRAFARETGQPGRVGDSSVKETWRQAYEVLRREDHYILVMIDDALGNELLKRLFGIF